MIVGQYWKSTGLNGFFNFNFRVAFPVSETPCPFPFQLDSRVK